MTKASNNYRDVMRGVRPKTVEIQVVSQLPEPTILDDEINEVRREEGECLVLP